MSDPSPTPQQRKNQSAKPTNESSALIFSEVSLRCKVCDALIDREDLFCANCGTEAPTAEGQLQPKQTLKFCFKCNGCGASMSYDASVQNLSCPFCGNQKMDSLSDQTTITAQWVIPFKTQQHQAHQILFRWLGSSFWRPNDLVRQAKVTQMRPVFVPYWSFAARTRTFWTADSSDVPWNAQGDWRPVTGEHQGQYEGVLIGASSVLTPAQTHALCPFNLAQAESSNHVDLTNWVVEQVKVQRKFARPQARLAIEELERNACQKYVPGRCRNMNVNVRLSAVEGHPVLLPIWILAYQYKGQLHRFLINGQTGRTYGSAPFSWWKVTAVAAAIFGFALLAVVVFGVISRS